MATLKHILIRLMNHRAASSPLQAVKLPPQDICLWSSSVAELSGLSLPGWMACQEPKLRAEGEESLLHTIPKSLKSQSADEGYHRGAACCKD